MRRVLACLIALGIGAAISMAAFSVAAEPPSVTFGSNISGASYQCAVDGGTYKACTSPQHPSLAPGAHTFLMKASFTVASTSTSSTSTSKSTTSTSSTSTSKSTTTTSTTTSKSTSAGKCTATLSSTSSVNGALTPGAVVCLSAGSYGSLTLTANPSSNATLTAAPGAKVTVAGLNLEDSNITVSDLHVQGGGIQIWQKGAEGSLHNDVIEHNDVGPTNGYGIGAFSKTSTPSEHIKIAWNEIHETSSTSEGDALRFDGWKHIEVIGNDIYDIKECSSNTCHTDTLQSYQANTPTEGLLLERNYIHDCTNAQGFPFLKDGDIQKVTIRDNLALRMSSNDPVTGIWVDENTQSLIVERNTYQATSGSQIEAGGSASNPSAIVTHNVFDALNSSGYKLTEEYNIYTGANEWSFTPGPHDSYKVTPSFKSTATDDYRLASNPNGIGVDWAPAEEHYGPVN